MSIEPKSENSLQPGLNAEVEITVSESETAAHMGSGLVPVYATPALVALMENAAGKIFEKAKEAGTYLRMGAFILALERIKEKMRG